MKFILVTHVDEVLEAAFEERFHVPSKIKINAVSASAISTSKL